MSEMEMFHQVLISQMEKDGGVRELLSTIASFLYQKTDFFLTGNWKELLLDIFSKEAVLAEEESLESEPEKKLLKLGNEPADAAEMEKIAGLTGPSSNNDIEACLNQQDSDTDLSSSSYVYNADTLQRVHDSDSDSLDNFPYSVASAGVSDLDYFMNVEASTMPDMLPLTTLPPLPDLSQMNQLYIQSSVKTVTDQPSSSRPTVKLPSPDMFCGANPMVLGHQFPLPYEFVRRGLYDVLYSNVDKTPLITRHVLTPSGMLWDRVNGLKRSSSFTTAKAAKTMFRSTLKGVQRPGHDRGHSVTAVDVGFDPEANDLMNIYIENSDLNRGINKNIEMFIRKIAMQSDYTIVLKGKMHVLRTTSDGSAKFIHYDVNGPDNVAVPQAFWKATASFVGPQCTFLNYWIMENVTPPKNSTMCDYFVQNVPVWEGSGCEIFKEYLSDALLINGIDNKK